VLEDLSFDVSKKSFIDVLAETCQVLFVLGGSNNVYVFREKGTEVATALVQALMNANNVVVLGN
jgi:hypothetical protein